jgi:23S rRNA pseudouridine1911/1915/1917 synthase
MSESREFLVAPEDGEGQRLDVFLSAKTGVVTRSQVQRFIDLGRVLVNGEGKKSSYKLRAGDRIAFTFELPEASEGIGPQDIPLDIVFENSDLIIVNKPAGMVVHPSPGHDSGTLVHAALGHAPDLLGVGGEVRPGIVHRLDKDTSGLIVIAKNEQSHRWLQEQFKSRSVDKIYLALVDGKPPTPTGRIEAPIGRNTTHRKLMAVVSLERGREAVTEYRTLESFPAHTLLEVHPMTGRTHQIRVHLAFLGCPVAGDTVYGKRKSTVDLNRHFLHACRLKIVLPGEKIPKVFEVGLPEELQKSLNIIKL